MRLKVKKRNIVKGICFVLLFACIVFGGLKLLFSSDIHMTSANTIEINSIVDYKDFIVKVDGGQIDDVKIDSSLVDVGKIGTYDVVYKYKKEEKVYKVKVVDTTPPNFDVVSHDVALNQTIDPQSLVTNIKDASQTKVYFDKNYQFEKLGEQTLQVIVEDEYHNKSQKSVEVNVVEDKEAPTIVASNISVLVDSKIDFMDYLTVKDDIDDNPTVDIQDDQVDLHQLGSYQLKILAKDHSDNQSEKTITVQVIDKTGESEKVVYLTFDDGPSRHTPEVLDILDKYHCKATFFITGMNPKYRSHIKEAHDKGHTIGLHTYSHSYSKVYSSVEAYFDDLQKVGELAKEYIGYVPKYIRFPGGSSNLVSKKYTVGIMSELTKMVEDKGYIYYDWNAENGDGRSHVSQSQMIQYATSSNANKIMILMHDANGKENTVKTLPKVIEYYQKKGYTFKAIDDSSFVPHQKVNN